ncbi:MAG: hypothetical protein IKU38_08305 [Clostridia bacterium]|nr:hypothetical protein [Clostridia bacterium]
MYGKYNAELDLAASGAISGGKLQKSGTLTLTFSTNLDYVNFERRIKAIDWNGNTLSPAVSSSEAGGSWSNDNEAVRAGYGSPHTVSVDMAAFCSAYALHGSNLGGMRVVIFITSSSPSSYTGGDEYDFYFDPTTYCGAPASPMVASTVSREAVLLSWGAGGAGTNNAVTGYDVQHCDSADGVSWGSWTTISGSPVTAAKISVTPPLTVGHYRKFRVRTRGSAGEEWYSEWVESANVLRRKWNTFGSWTDPTLTAGVSGIRAVHLTQLQERVNTIRAFYGLGTYGFTVVTPRVTKIARWAALIGEIRTAIDTVAANHEAWNTLEAGKPRIAHIMQLRRVIDAL